jgi:ATP-binding cassette subfamily C protein
MTVMVFACGAGLVWFLRGKTRISYKAGEGLSKAMTSLYAAITEHLGGMKTAKSYGAEGRHAEVFGKLTEEVLEQYVHAVRNQAEVRYWFSTGSVLVLSFILYMSIEIMTIPTAEMLLLLYLYARIMPKFSSLQENYQAFLNLFPSFSSITETQARCENAAEPKAKSAERIDFRNSIRFDQVWFGYDKQNGTPVITGLNLTLRTGETTAIVGPSGVGKTTVADLVMGLIVPDRGRVLVDGIPLSPERVTGWREKIGYVAQDTFLFHDTIRANLLWANPGATEEEIIQSLELAAAEEFVSRLPRKLDTVIGDRGVLVSGGEKQRLALARALLRKPSLLILDEATSSLDSENEKRIQHAIERLHGHMTILVITHRLSTIREADIIHVLDEGHLVESGTWNELTGRKAGRFRELCVAQGIT